MKFRFAPSPTGYLHIGNIRTALVNWLYARQMGGQFLLRMDDTDDERSEEKYVDAIKEDMRWLGLIWDSFSRQSDRLGAYEEARQKLIKMGRLYPCYESVEELDIKRKMQLSRGLPPIYDRAALALSDAEKKKCEAEGRQAHWRYLLQDRIVSWDDEIRGKVTFTGNSMSDPVLFRSDLRPTYILASVVDDAELNITHVVRGEDHVSNTAIQIQMLEDLYGEKSIPTFAHLALLKTKDGEISKRLGGHDVQAMRADGIEPMALCSMLSKIGTSDSIEAWTDMNELVQSFDIKKFGRAPAHYDAQELAALNHKVLSQLPFEQARARLEALGLTGVDAPFWWSVRSNITRLSEAAEWWEICKRPLSPVITDATFAAEAASLLPSGEWNEQTWDAWIDALKQKTGKKGKDLFMPIRRALTARDSGPELKMMLPLIGREKAEKRLRGEAA